MDPRTLLFPDNFFTHAYCNRLTSWNENGKRRVLAEIYRTLQPGGYAFFSAAGNADWMPALSEAFKIVLPGEAWRGSYKADPELRRELVDALITAGFAAHEIQLYASKMYFQLKNPLEIYRWATLKNQPWIQHIGRDSELQLRWTFMELLTDAQRQRSQTTMSVIQAVAMKGARQVNRGLAIELRVGNRMDNRVDIGVAESGAQSTDGCIRKEEN